MARGVSTGASSSVPTSDQVPELMNAVPSRAVIAATADAVSCDADATTGVPASVLLPAATSARIGPMIDPGSTIGAARRAGRFRRFIKSADHVLVRGFISCVVDASVYSQTYFAGQPVIEEIGNHDETLGGIEESTASGGWPRRAGRWC